MTLLKNLKTFCGNWFVMFYLGILFIQVLNVTHSSYSVVHIEFSLMSILMVPVSIFLAIIVYFLVAITFYHGLKDFYRYHLAMRDQGFFAIQTNGQISEEDLRGILYTRIYAAIYACICWAFGGKSIFAKKLEREEYWNNKFYERVGAELRYEPESTVQKWKLYYELG